VPLRRKQPPTIRQYRHTDDPQIWALESLGAGARGDAPLPLPPAESPPPDSADLADIGATFLRSGGDFLVAEIGGHLVGTAGLLIGDEGRADVVRVTVHPAVRRQGIGTALMEAIEHRAVGLGIRRLNLDVGENSKDAIAFYLAAGFHKLDDDDDTEQRWDVKFFSKAI
jgi:GNAT superfamily N-acetyltransferase